jgi:GNAT superfamily N-acetyltransferase
VDAHHRHHQPPNGGIGAVACFDGGTLVGVAIIARPVARLFMDTDTAEITRLCVLPDHRNAASWLYARAKRLAQAWGFVRVVTYTLPSESGASLRAAGFQLDGVTAGGSWHRESRPREDNHPLDPKLRWSA